MVLLGDQEETNYRVMQRTLIECFSATPVAGLQSYLRSFTTIIDVKGREYIHPKWCSKMPLRNLRLHRTIALNDLLRDGKFSTYKVNSNDQGNRSKTTYVWLWMWSAFSWVLFGTLVSSVIFYSRYTWIGYTNCALLTAWSIVIRLVDRFCIVVGSHKEASDPDMEDAVFMLGRRNSCFMLRGIRRDMSRWTDWDLHCGKKKIHRFLDGFVRLGTLLLMLFIFTTIPNGSTGDQVAFVCQNVLAQVNVWVGQRLNSSRCLASLDKMESRECKTRTHAYRDLIVEFGNDDWVDAVSLLPNMAPWKRWRARIMDWKDDAKELYEQCLDEEKAAAIAAAPEISKLPAKQHVTDSSSDGETSD